MTYPGAFGGEEDQGRLASGRSATDATEELLQQSASVSLLCEDGRNTTLYHRAAK